MLRTLLALWPSGPSRRPSLSLQKTDRGPPCYIDLRFEGAWSGSSWPRENTHTRAFPIQCAPFKSSCNTPKWSRCRDMVIWLHRLPTKVRCEPQKKSRHELGSPGCSLIKSSWDLTHMRSFLKRFFTVPGWVNPRIRAAC